uniref:Regulatory protein zeste n=1 Tax=Photinus pyralis TaxID=7054 RepID=A0A1Y1KNH9_PHOPY
MCSNEKKVRAANFTAKEEAILTSLVKQYEHVLECKKTDAVTNQQKTEAWSNVAREFNVVNDSHRSEAVLKKKFENLKKRVKKKLSENKTYSMGTGGGPYKDTPLNDTEEGIKDILGPRAEGFQSQFDGDAIEIEIPETDDLQVSNEMIVEFANDHDYSSTVKPSATDDIENNGDKNWKKYTPNMLKRKKSAALCVNTTGKITFRNVL